MLNPVRKGFNSHNVYTCVDPWVCGAPPVNCHRQWPQLICTHPSLRTLHC